MTTPNHLTLAQPAPPEPEQTEEEQLPDLLPELQQVAEVAIPAQRQRVLGLTSDLASRLAAGDEAALKDAVAFLLGEVSQTIVPMVSDLARLTYHNDYWNRAYTEDLVEEAEGGSGDAEESVLLREDAEKLIFLVAAFEEFLKRKQVTDGPKSPEAADVRSLIGKCQFAKMRIQRIAVDA